MKAGPIESTLIEQQNISKRRRGRGPQGHEGNTFIYISLHTLSPATAIGKDQK